MVSRMRKNRAACAQGIVDAKAKIADIDAQLAEIDRRENKILAVMNPRVAKRNLLHKQLRNSLDTLQSVSMGRLKGKKCNQCVVLTVILTRTRLWIYFLHFCCLGFTSANYWHCTLRDP